jgi:hypothetical protein
LFAADRTGGTAKAFSNGPEAALVIAHGHHGGSFLSLQVVWIRGMAAQFPHSVVV